MIDLLFPSQEEKQILGLFDPDEIPAEVTNFRESQPVHFQGFSEEKIDPEAARPINEEKARQFEDVDSGGDNVLESVKNSSESLQKNNDQKAEEQIVPAQVAMQSEQRAETADIAPDPLNKEIVEPARLAGFSEASLGSSAAEKNPSFDVEQFQSQVPPSVDSASSTDSSLVPLAPEQIAKSELSENQGLGVISDLEKPVVSIQDRESMPRRIRRKLVLVKQDLRVLKTKIHLAAFQVWSGLQGMLSKAQEKEADSPYGQEEEITGSGLEEAMLPEDDGENGVVDKKSLEVRYVNDINNSVQDLRPEGTSSSVEESGSAPDKKLQADGSAGPLLAARDAIAQGSMTAKVVAAAEFSSEQQKSSASEPEVNDTAPPSDLSVALSSSGAETGKAPVSFGEGIMINDQGIITNTAAPLPKDEEFTEAMAQVTAIDFDGPKGQALSSVVLKGARLKDYTLLKSNAKHYMLTINNAEMARESLLAPPQVPESTLGFISLIPKQEKDKVLVKIEVDDSVRLRSSLVDDKLWLKAIKK